MTGNGTQLSPYIITTLADLDAVRNDLSAYYELGADIDAADTSIWNSGAGWIPIGNSTTPFIGKFDGKGFCIDNLHIQLNQYRLGLFGVCGSTTTTALIQNLGLTNLSMNLTSYSDIGYVGAISGVVRTNTTIKKCFATGSIATTLAYFVGGLVGYCASSDDASANYIEDCWSNVSISGCDNYIGGIAGIVYPSTFISRCHARGSITGVSDKGGICGAHYTPSRVVNCFWDTQTSGLSTSSGGTGLTTAQMKIQSSFTNWDFSSAWTMPSNNYPTLRVFADLIEILGAVNLLAQGYISAIGHSIKLGNTDLLAQGDLSSKGVTVKLAQVNQVDQGDISAAGYVIMHGHSNLSGQSDIDASSLAVKLGQGNLIGSSSVQVSGLKIVFGHLEMTGDSSIIAYGVPIAEIIGKVNMTGSSDISSTGICMVYGKVTIQSQGEFTADGKGIMVGVIHLDGAMNLEVSAIAILSGQAKLIGESNLFANGLIVIIVPNLNPQQYVIEYPVELSTIEYPLSLSLMEYPIQLHTVDYPISMSIEEYEIEMEVFGMPLIGATVTLGAVFPETAGDLSTLSDIKVKIYDSTEQLLTTIEGVNIIKKSDKEYNADYTVSDAGKKGYDLFYEWSGTIEGTRVLLGRKPLGRRWI